MWLIYISYIDLWAIDTIPVMIYRNCDSGIIGGLK